MCWPIVLDTQYYSNFLETKNMARSAAVLAGTLAAYYYSTYYTTQFLYLI